MANRAFGPKQEKSRSIQSSNQTATQGYIALVPNQKKSWTRNKSKNVSRGAIVKNPSSNVKLSYYMELGFPSVIAFNCINIVQIHFKVV